MANSLPFAVLFTVPLLLALLLIYHYDSTRSAASWSVLSRQIHSSAWPSVFRVDSVATQHVHWSITGVAYLNIALAFLGIVSGVITPLGLGEEIKAATTRNAQFEYATDFSAFGNGTMARPDMPMSRDCQIRGFQCPGAVVPGAILNQSGTDPKPNPDVHATTKIPQNITDMFRSATNGSTVASSMDIQYRSWMPFRSEWFNDREPYVKGRFKHIDMLLSREQYTLAEGVIADTMSGGIGYRNHTVPTGLSYGGEWDEDILWIEPDITCVDNKLSLEVILDEPSSDEAQYRSLKLVDNGGIAHLPTANPYDNWPNITFSSPDVFERANRTAWLGNLLTSMILNLTDADGWTYGMNVSTGQHYNISRNDSNIGFSPELGVSTQRISPEWLADGYAGYFRTNGSLVGRNGSILYPQENYPDVWATALFSELSGRCSGEYSDASMQNDHNVACGYFFGAGGRIDGGQELMEEVGSEWEQPLYTCAGAVKASVKTVTFSMNGSLVLDNLAVKMVQDKVYDKEEDQPLWAMEDWWHPGSEGALTAPLWGIVDDSYDGTPGYNFTRSSALYLALNQGWTNVADPLDMLAAAQAPAAALQEVLAGFDSFRSSSKTTFPAYSGEHSFSLMSKWRELSKTAEGSAKILRLVWTDILASGTVGTNLQKSSAKRSVLAADERTVNAYVRRLTYDMRYAIPAVILLVTWVSLLFIGFVAGFLNGHPFRKLKMLLNDTSVGRYAASTMEPASKSVLRATSGRWLDGAGYIPVKLGGEPTQEAFQMYKAADDSGQSGKSRSASVVQLLERNASHEGISQDPKDSR